MEADFNFTNKQIYGVRMLSKTRKYGLMAEEIFSEKGRTAEDGALAKVLFYEIVRQFRLCAAIGSVDASNCYDSIAHAIASLIVQAFGVPKSNIKAMLSAIQNMKYFLQTAFGDSKNFANATLEIKYQGLCQGNGAAPAGWAVISITILGAYKRAGHSATFVCPISKQSGKLSAILFVDDCDLIHIAMDKTEGPAMTHQRLQDAITDWGMLLIATGGGLKPPKCFYHLMAFGFKPSGEYYYEPLHEEEEFDVYVPMPDGSEAPIEHLPVDTAKKTLGVWSCPAGKAVKLLAEMKEKTQEWVDRAKEAVLKWRDVWFLADKQMWPSVGYGISTSMAKLKDLEGCLKNPYWRLVPLGGVILTAPAVARQLDRGFFGVGLPHPGVECLVAQSQAMLTHYGCKSALGHQMQVSFNCFLVELGMGAQPFQEDYRKCNGWVTRSWAKRFWEKASTFGLSVVLQECPIQLPRERGKWLMREPAQAIEQSSLASASSHFVQYPVCFREDSGSEVSLSS